MSPLCNSSSSFSSATITAALHQLLSLFMADTLTFFFFLSHHPLHLIYLLLSFPYLLPILSFLSPLLLSTSLLLLLTLLVTTSSLSHHHHHHPHSLLALLAVLKHNLDDKDPSAALTVIANDLLQALLGDTENTQLCLSGHAAARHRALKQRSMSVGGRREFGGPEVLLRDGSMRKEKEWKRTLACKLYEERITFKLCDETTKADKGEEMDLLWEAYEYDNSKNSKGKKDGGGDRMSIVEQQDKKSEVDGGDDDEVVVGKQLCCLQALRMSTRKMSLRGVGATNLVKVSKVLKGISLFQSVRGSRRAR